MDETRRRGQLSRRSFLRTLGAAGGTALLAACGGGATTGTSPTAGGATGGARPRGGR